jgi:mRNA interferase MazF
VGVVAARFEVFLMRLDPTEGHEIKKTRPCLVISPDEMNQHIGTVIVAPMTTKGRPYPTRVPVAFRRKVGQIVLDQLRTVDKGRLVKRVGKIDEATARSVLALLGEMRACWMQRLPVGRADRSPLPSESPSSRSTAPLKPSPMTLALIGCGPPT